MPKARLIMTNFSGGESSPLMRGRVDVPRYPVSCEKLKNMIVLLQGGATGRPGSVFVANMGERITQRKLPFVLYRRDLTPPVQQGYVIIFRSDNKIRFATNGALIMNGGHPYEIASPFTDADLSMIDYDQFQEKLHLTHPDFPPQVLKRSGDTSWTIENDTIKTVRLGRVKSITRTDNVCTVETRLPHNFESDQKIRISGCTEADYNGIQKITKLNAVMFTYRIATTPATPASHTSMILAGVAIKGITLAGQTATAETENEHDYETDDYVTVEGAVETEYNGTFIITKIDDTHFSYTITGAPASPATGDITCNETPGIPFSAATGYPNTLCFFEQRKYYAGTNMRPTTLWGSISGKNMKSFKLNVLDNSAFELTLAAARTKIRHLVATKQINILTFDRELLLKGSAEKAITPSDFKITSDSECGAGAAKPVRMGNEVIFSTWDDKGLRALGYNFEADAFRPQDLSFIAEHLTGRGIRQLAYSPQESLVWVACADGTFLALTLNREYQVVAWSQHDTPGAGGLVTDICVIPHEGRDQVWLSVSRVIGGVTYTYLEYLQPGVHTDSSSLQTDAAGKKIWTGLDHLEDETVDIVADGVVMPQQTVTGGQITLPRNAYAVTAGLSYLPELIDLPPEFQAGFGTTQAAAISTSKIIVRLHESIGCEINGEVIPFRAFGQAVLDNPVQPFTGDKKIDKIGWGAGQVTIRQPQPLPITVLAIIKEVTANA